MPIAVLSRWYPYLIHLRLHYQLVFLSPLFAWGLLVGGAQFSSCVLVGFTSFHVFLYGGITAFNSCYDRDRGPVGGLRAPPAVPQRLLPFSIFVQLLGLVLAITVNTFFTALYLVVVVLSVLYSHPRFRWKSDPILSLFVVALGQGAVGFAAGWACSVSGFRSLFHTDGVLGLATASLFTVGLFPLTQLYQIAEDRDRGDRTFAVEFGAEASFRFALVCLLGAGVCMSALLMRRFDAPEVALLTLGYAGLLLAIDAWRRHFRVGVLSNFELLHRLQYGLSAAMFAYMLLLWARH